MDARLSFATPVNTRENEVITGIIGYLKLWTPKDTGNLRNSFYRRGTELGYTAPYAVYVHENSNNLHSPPTRYKWLEDAAIQTATECSFIGRIGITYEPLAIHINSNQGSTLYNGEE